ncbi:MAG: hypothetical protein E6G62_08165 [Actinobacteria bacterium]|nr:MAG: hypothetical protein E6G62_08165 [Actinomycetota bacterium]
MLWGDDRRDQQHARQRRVEGRADERLRASFGEQHHEREDRHERHRGERRRPCALLPPERPGQRGERQEGAGHRACERAHGGERERRRLPAVLRRQQRSETQREPEVEGHASGEQGDRGADREEHGGAGEAAGDQRSEQGGGERHAERGKQLGTDGPAERGREQAVGGKMVPAVPRVVPEREAFPAEQVAAVGGGGEVRAGWSGDHIRQPQQGGDRPCGHPRRTR